MNPWQPIETAPKDGTSILGFEGGAPLPMRWLDGYWQLDYLWWREDDNLVDPSHWMPFPPDPTD